MDELVLDKDDYVLECDLDIKNHFTCTGKIIIVQDEDRWKTIDTKKANIINKKNKEKYIIDDSLTIYGNLYIKNNVNLNTSGTTNMFNLDKY